MHAPHRLLALLLSPPAENSEWLGQSSSSISLIFCATLISPLDSRPWKSFHLKAFLLHRHPHQLSICCRINATYSTGSFPSRTLASNLPRTFFVRLHLNSHRFGSVDVYLLSFMCCPFRTPFAHQSSFEVESTVCHLS